MIIQVRNQDGWSEGSSFAGDEKRPDSRFYWGRWGEEYWAGFAAVNPSYQSSISLRIQITSKMNSFPWLQMLVTQFPTHDFDIFHLHFKFSNKASRKYALIKFHFNILNFSTNNKSLQSDNNWLITGFY